MRRHYTNYLRPIPGSKDIRRSLMQANTLEEVQEKIAAILERATEADSKVS